MTPLGSAVTISLTTALCASALCALVGIPVACLLAIRDFVGKRVVLRALEALLAIPTVVVGLGVYALIRRDSWMGGLELLFTPQAIIIGQFVLALPIMVVFCHSALTSLEREALDTARTLGVSWCRIARTLVSEARFGIVAAFTATFGRVIGEVGVAMMLGGNIAGYTRTMTTAIALETAKGEFGLALWLGGILVAIALGVNLTVGLLRGAERVA